MPGGNVGTGAGATPSTSLEDMIASMTGAFRSMSMARSMPSMKLPKFKGTPQKPGDLTVREWFDEFDEYCQYYQLSEREKAQVLVTHLSGPAKDEIMCMEASLRDDPTGLRRVLMTRFGLRESVQSLSSELHHRVQLDGESLADFSSVLIRLHDRMEAAASIPEKEALERLRDMNLKEKFVRGVRDKQIQRELRRILISSGSGTFLTMREEVLNLFQDTDTVPRPRVRECEVETARVEASSETAEIKTMKEEISLLKEGLSEVVKEIESLQLPPHLRQKPKKKELHCFNCKQKGHVQKNCVKPPRCYGCDKPGHFKKDCPEVMETVRESPKAIVKIAGVETGCILDTGAESSLVPLSYYERYLEGIIGDLEGTDSGLRVTGISGAVPIVGYFRAPVTANGKTDKVGFLVIKDVVPCKRKEYPVLLGSNALYSFVGDESQSGKTAWQMVAEVLKAFLKPVLNPETSTVLKTRDNDEVITPLTVRRLECHVDNAAQWDGRDVLVRVIRDESEDSSNLNLIDLFDGCTQVKGERLHVTVANRSEQQLVIEPNTTLASATRIERKSEIVLQEQNNTVEVMVTDIEVEPGAVNNDAPVKETLEALGGASYFSSLDLANGYFQVAMDKDSIDKTAFRVPWGLFEFKRMPQGLVNSPSTFQRVMELVLGDLNMTQVIIYLDDILIYSITFEEHIERLQAVFTRLTNNGLKLKGKKCKFLQKRVNHLCHVVTAEGISVDPGKIERIRDWPTPSSPEELRSFLGLASYYRRFITGFAQIASPLHALVGKTQKSSKKSRRYQKKKGDVSAMFEWTDEAEKSLATLKRLLTSTPVLSYPTAKLGATEQRWIAQLAPFDLEIRYRSGRSNRCADALSRCSVLPVELSTEPQIKRKELQGEPLQAIGPGIFPLFSLEELKKLQEQDESLGDLGLLSERMATRSSDL
ncbi:uncharacterized protein K02A2.6-like [Lytechinus variegatus]|uniref:uncharacterized protein K02A2.6-like n=1 Tax=Lytechinus variegatus TaxID=7654 RepID=UPI001BB203DB|nr:uncharacterized protein K02A2.6-like [Lytechinus variegatus]